MLLLILSACSSDFYVTPLEADAVEPEDTGTWLDTAVPEDEEPEPEEEPVDEEPEPEEDPEPEDDCDHTSDLVYVIDRDRDTVFLFDPPSLSFSAVGTLACSTYGTPASMAVARDGLAYVRYSDDTVYAVDLETFDCEETTFSLHKGLDSFGMGYATQDAETWRDDLYVADADRLMRLDTATWELKVMGNMPSQSELTGNAEGELWAMLPLESPAALARIDKSDGSEVERLKLPGFPDPYGIDTFAFATWGGEFFLFVREYGMGQSTDVYRVAADGNMTKAKTDIGFDVVGAGVSTCAPAE
ncbi:MAG: hypothetical protein GY913_24760 [Proteobacteria bacterium]|nr:hypothetical protein [Pseudomonadota bacterium]MCP4920127.1 hypothetical protein [Pseudomonadota bacterium]